MPRQLRWRQQQKGWHEGEGSRKRRSRSFADSSTQRQKMSQSEGESHLKTESCSKGPIAMKEEPEEKDRQATRTSRQDLIAMRKEPEGKRHLDSKKKKKIGRNARVSREFVGQNFDHSGRAADLSMSHVLVDKHKGQGQLSLSKDSDKSKGQDRIQDLSR